MQKNNNTVLTDEVAADVGTLLANSPPIPDRTWRIMFYHHIQPHQHAQCSQI